MKATLAKLWEYREDILKFVIVFGAFWWWLLS
jgi:hypothetical protein